ncbi:hypothetical protein HMI55_003601 [Coelomomyces lativittatus]|nr:hypothetical protein HMI55_003601 [Coelomomyces lativittatus]
MGADPLSFFFLFYFIFFYFILGGFIFIASFLFLLYSTQHTIMMTTTSTTKLQEEEPDSTIHFVEYAKSSKAKCNAGRLCSESIKKGTLRLGTRFYGRNLAVPMTKYRLNLSFVFISY